MKLFNFSLGGNATTLNIKEESVNSSIFVCVKQYVCVCVRARMRVCVLFLLKKKKNLKQWVKKKNQPKKIMH